MTPIVELGTLNPASGRKKSLEASRLDQVNQGVDPMELDTSRLEFAGFRISESPLNAQNLTVALESAVRES